MLLREHSSTSCFPKLQLVLPLLSHFPLVSHCNLNQRRIQVHSCSAQFVCCTAAAVLQCDNQGSDVLNLPRLAHRKLALP